MVDSPEQAERARRIASEGTSYIRDFSVPLVQAARRSAFVPSLAETAEGKRRVDALRAMLTALLRLSGASHGAAGQRGRRRPASHHPRALERGRDEITRLLDEQAALRRVATLVAQARSRSAVFETVTREVGLLSGADLARMERYAPDGTVTGVAGWSRSEDSELSVGSRFSLEGVSVAALARQSGQPVRVDTLADASGPIAEEARPLGVRSSVGCPIVVEGRLWGVIAASSKGDEVFPAGTESQISEFTELVATASSASRSAHCAS